MPSRGHAPIARTRSRWTVGRTSRTATSRDGGSDMTEQPRDLRDDRELMADDASSAADDLDPDSDDSSGTRDGTSLGSDAVESDPAVRNRSAGRDALLGDDTDFSRRWDE